MQKITTLSQEQTEKLGMYIGQLLSSGDVVCLTGDLGTGKTAMVKGIAKGIGVGEFITSPTFTIVNEYQGRHKLYHFDVYRVHDIDELDDIGFDDYVYDEAISIIEWAELISPIIPKNNIWIKISKDITLGEDYREIAIEANGDRYLDLLQQLSRIWSA